MSKKHLINKLPTLLKDAKISILPNIASIFLVAMATSSCEHKELCYDHSHMVELDVRFDWSAAPDANPESMSVYFIPTVGGSPERYEFIGLSGGHITVREGDYHVICLNSDTRNIICRNTNSLYTFEITSAETSLLQSFAMLGIRSDQAPRKEGSENMRVIASPEKVWSSVYNDLHMSKDHNYEISLTPEKIVDEVAIEIKDVDNIDRIKAASASIYDMGGGFLPGLKTATDERVILPFDLKADKTDNTLKGTMRTFGHCPETTGNHVLYIYVVMKDGSQWYYTYDITEQIHASDDGSGNWDISISGLPLPEPDADGGLRPTVTEWSNINIEIKM